MPDTQVYAPGNSYGKDITKAAELDRDATIPLTKHAADVFASTANAALSKPETQALMSGGKAEAFAKCVTDNKLFPFTATLENGVVVLAPALDKREKPYMLKCVSDGFTEVYKDLVRSIEVSEGFKVAFTQMLQPALYQAYVASDMPEGPHTAYTLRSC
jgi:hypothetical protein